MINSRLYIKDIVFHVIQRRLRRFPVAILMYHSVGNNEHFFTVTPENFRWQMSYLKNNGYEVAPLADVVEKISNREKLPYKTIILTFDDGYEDNFTNAFPVLREFNFPATIFISTDFISTNRQVRGTLMRYLSDAQILKMHSSGLVDFQSHGKTHRKLTELSLDEIENEMIGSQAELEKLLGVSKNLFAYPYGALNENIRMLTEKFFRGAVGVRRGYVSANSDIMDLERQSIDSKTTNIRFSLKI